MSYIKYIKRVVLPEYRPFDGSVGGASPSLLALWQAAKARGDIISERFSPFLEEGSVQHIIFEFKDEEAYNRVQAEMAADQTAVVVPIFVDSEEPIEGPLYWEANP